RRGVLRLDDDAHHAGDVSAVLVAASEAPLRERPAGGPQVLDDGALPRGALHLVAVGHDNPPWDVVVVVRGSISPSASRSRRASAASRATIPVTYSDARRFSSAVWRGTQA